MISLKKAPKWLAISYALIETTFVLPVLMLFYGYKGVNMGDFFLIQGIAALAIFVLEVPTGYLGDIFSRKNTLLLGFISWIAGHLIWIFGSGFWLILVGELIFAVSISFISGTLEAYFYDLLKKRHKEAKFHKKYAKMKFLNNIFITVATLTGAFIYQYFGPLVPVWLSVICYTAGTIIIALLPDVPESKRIVAENKSKWQDILDISTYAMKHKEIKWLMVFPAVYGSLTLVLLWGLQSVMIIKNIPVTLFGIIMGINYIARTIWSGLSGKILERIHLSGIIKLLSVIIVIAAVGACISQYVPTAMTYVCLILMILGSSSVVLSNIATTVLINHRIQSDERATILSVSSMVNRIFWGFSMISLKPLFDHIGVSQTFMVAALLLIPILACASHLYKMHLQTLKTEEKADVR